MLPSPFILYLWPCFPFFLILRHLFLSNVISVSPALSLPSSMSRYYISLSLHLSVFLPIPLDLSIITPLSLFSLFCSPQPAVGEGKQRVMCLRQKHSSALPLSHEWPPQWGFWKSQVDQVDSPPSAGLTTNQYECKLIAVNSYICGMKSRVLTAFNELDKFLLKFRLCCSMRWVWNKRRPSCPPL